MAKSSESLDRALVRSIGVFLILVLVLVAASAWFGWAWTGFILIAATAILAATVIVEASREGFIASIAGLLYWIILCAIILGLAWMSVDKFTDIGLPGWFSENGEQVDQATPQAEITASPTSINSPQATPTDEVAATAIATSDDGERAVSPSPQPADATSEVQATPAVTPLPSETPSPTATPSPIETPTPQPSVNTVWEIGVGGGSQPIEGAVAILVFNESDPALVVESDSRGKIQLLLDESPEMGQNQVGRAHISHDGYAPTVVSFRYDLESRELIPITAAGEDMSNNIPLFAEPELPVYLRQGEVVGDCSSVECAVEVIRTSGYTRPNLGIRCEEFLLENPSGTSRTVRSNNGYSVVFASESYGPTSDPLSVWQCHITGKDAPMYVLQANGSIVWPRNQ